MVDDEYCALLGRQEAEASLHLVADGRLTLGVAVPSRVGRGHVDLHDLALLDTPCLPIAGVDEQPMEPGVEPVGVANGADVQPSGQERLLNGIGRPVIATQDQACRSMQPIERRRGERREGVVVAVAAVERGLAASDTRLVAADQPRSPIMSRTASEIVPSHCSEVANGPMRVRGMKMERPQVNRTHNARRRRISGAMSEAS